jgi:hypothetical protein
MSETDTLACDAIALGSRLSGQRIVAASPARAAGGNNRVLCLDTADGLHLALKFYPSRSIDGRDRLGQEFEALSFLARHGVTSTPRPIAAAPDRDCALYEWFDGEPARLRPQPDDVDQLATFLIKLQELRHAAVAQALRAASAAVFSPSEVVAQYEQRLGRLLAASSEFPDLRAFVDRGLIPSGEAAIRRLEQQYAHLAGDADAPLEFAHRALSPSDFGLHNALRGKDGGLRFVDFEYFGWDDPVKLLSDTAIHPGSNFSEADASRLVGLLSPAFEARDPAFAVRRDVLYPLFGFIWCLIILNDFLPSSRTRRMFAPDSNELGAALARQLDKARQLHQAMCRRDPDLAPR